MSQVFFLRKFLNQNETSLNISLKDKVSYASRTTKHNDIHYHILPEHFDCVGSSNIGDDRIFTATYKAPHFGRSGNKITAAQNLILLFELGNRF